VAVRIARAATGRDEVAICGYHGWHDWSLAANLSADDAPSGGNATRDALRGHLLPGLAPAGVPSALAGTAHTFHYNKLAELDAVLARSAGKLAAIVMEPTRGIDPEPGFLEGVRERANRAGAKLIFDEISIGWRLCLGGAHRKFGVEPDLAVFAKTTSNGFALGAIIGNAETMQAAQGSFISSAYWTEGIGPAAGVAAVKKMMRLDVPGHLRMIGDLVRAGWNELAAKHQLPIHAAGRPELAVLAIDHPQAAVLQTMMTARMVDRGFLASAAFNPMLAHEPRHVEAYLAALDEVFAELAQAIAAGDIDERLKTPVKHAGFGRLTG
jgi:glutamate-1-semialdehyde 2,1-aminomutase